MCEIQETAIDEECVCGQDTAIEEESVCEIQDTAIEEESVCVRYRKRV